MIDLSFQVDSAEPVAHAMAPLLAFKVRIVDRRQASIHTIVLRCQVRIDTGATGAPLSGQLIELFD